MNDPRPFDSQEHEAIALRAYEIWQRRGCPQGSAEQDWLDAERELRAERLARLEATRLFEPPIPVELAPPQAAVAPAVAASALDGAAPKRRRRTPAQSAAAKAAPASAAGEPPSPVGRGTRVVRKRPARPDA